MSGQEPSAEDWGLPQQAPEPAADAAGWGMGQAEFAQNDIDNLFGSDDGPAPKRAKQGLEALFGDVVRYERLPMMEIVVDRLARLLTSSVRKFTADNAEVTIDRIKPVRVGAFLDTITLPALIGVIRIEEWDGYCLATLDSRLIGSIVDILLGGRRNAVQRIEGRPYTAIERTFVEKLVAVLTQDLSKAFGSVCPATFTLERFEITPNYALITKPSASAITFRAEITMEGRGGNIDFLLPYAAFEPVKDLLAQEVLGKKSGGDTIWRAHLVQELPRAPVELRAVIENRDIPFSEISKWQVGTVVPLHRRRDEPVDVYCQGLLAFRATIAAKGDRIVLPVQEKVIENDWLANRLLDVMATDSMGAAE